MPDQQPPWPTGVPQPPNDLSWVDIFKGFWISIGEDVPLGSIQNALESWIPPVVTGFVTALLYGRALMGEALGNAINEAQANTFPMLTGLAATGLSDYFDTPISAESVASFHSGGGRSQMAADLGSLVMKSMFGGFDSLASVSPEVGEANAKRLIGYNLSTALEGWLEGLLGPGFLHDFIPTFAQLDDVVANTLGLGRITRRVMTPLINALIIQPYTQKINRTYRPSVYSETQAVRALNRGQMTEPEYFDLMARLGWDQEKAGELRVILGPTMSLDQVRGLLELGTIDANGARQMVQAMGYDANAASLIVSLLRQDRIRALHAEAVAVARAMYVAREITDAELADLLTTAGLTSLERDQVRVVAGLQRSRPAPMPRSTMEDAFDEDLVSSQELTTYYDHEGYAPRDREILLGLALKKKAAALEAKHKREAEEAAKTHRPLPEGDALELHRRGLISSQALAVYLRALGFQGEPAAAIVSLAEQRRRDYLLALQRAAAAAAPSLAPRGVVEDSYIRGLVDEDSLRDFYDAAGYSDEAITFLVRLAVQRRNDYLESIADAATRATEEEKRKAEAAARAAAAEERRKAAEEARANRPLPEAQATELYRRGLIDRPQLAALLKPLGLQGAPAQLALSLADQQRQDYVTARAKAAAAAAPDPAPRSAEEEAFVRGLVQLDTLHAYYVGRGYDPAAVALLEELAQQQRDEYEARQAAQAAARATQGTKARN